MILLSVSLFAIILFYLPVMLRNWFFSDDLHWISVSATHTLREMFFVPERGRSLASNFTPMLGASFKIDWILFKMNPAGYSIHSLLSLGAALAAFYFFLRLYVQRNAALFGVLFFLLSPITLTVTSWFSTRHYIEGLFWALLSLSFFAVAERKDKISVPAAACYLISALNKEVYVVLPAVAFLVSSGNFSRRLKHTLPLWLCLALYAVWRVWIMGGLGGYPSNQHLSLGVVPYLLQKICASFSVQWLGGYSLLFYIFIFILVVFAFSLKKWTIFIIFLVLSLPVLPVANILTGRYFLPLTVFLICAVCLSLGQPDDGRRKIYKSVLLFTSLLILAAFIRQDMGLSTVTQNERLKAKETAAAFASSEGKYFLPEQPHWFYESLRAINKEFFGKEIRTLLVPQKDLLAYVSAEQLREIKESGINIPYNEMLEHQKRFRQGPLAIHLKLENYKISWDFGPHKDSVYTFLFGPLSGLYYYSTDLVASGKYMLGRTNKDNAPDKVFFRVLYRDRDGVEVVSPEFEFSVPGSQKIEYSN